MAAVRAVRGEELEVIEKMKVWKIVPLETCWQETGKKPIGTKWVDVNKGDRDNMQIRSRLVAKELRATATGPMDDVYSATPPYEAVRLLFSMAMTGGYGRQGGPRGGPTARPADS
jgi:hypothetical protein